MENKKEKYLFGHIAQEEGYINRKQRIEALRVQHQRRQQKKKVPRIGEILVKLDFITDKTLEYLLNLQPVYGAMKPRLPYSKTNTIFGRSLTEYLKDKRAVALYITSNHVLIKENDNLFISDGSHGYYLFLAIVMQGQKVEIVTNNLGVAGEYTLRSGKVSKMKFPSNGTVDADYGGLFALQHDYLLNELSNANTFVSVKALDPIEGPCMDHTRAVIRSAAIESGSKVTILADYHTMSHVPEFHAPIFVGQKIQTWRNWLKKRYSHIITTIHPEMPESEVELSPERRSPCAITDDEPHSWKRYSQNSRILREAMGDRFVEVDRNGNALHYK